MSVCISGKRNYYVTSLIRAGVKGWKMRPWQLVLRTKQQTRVRRMEA